MFKAAITILMASVCALVPANAVMNASGDDKSGPEVGQKAPDFKLPYATQDKAVYDPKEGMSLSEYHGKTVVLAFYPADWSSGCTTELCTFRDTFKDLDRFGAVILGISGDYVFSHHEWAKHHKLTFPLLADHDHAVAKAYASFDPSWGYNKRTIFVVDGDGVVRYRNLDFKHGDKAHYDNLRAAIDKLKQK